MKKIILCFLFFCNILFFLNADFYNPEIEFNILNQQFEVFTGTTAIIEIEYIIPEGYHQTLQEDFFDISITEKKGIKEGKTIYPDDYIIEHGLKNYYNTIILQKEIMINNNATIGSVELLGSFMFQICLDNGTCLIPEEKEFIITLNIKQGENYQGNSFTIKDLFYYILLAFLGGILMNFTPCVLPVLTMRAYSIVSQAQAERKTIILNGIIYTFGIVVSFIIMALVITLIKLSTGESGSWGAQNSSIGYNLVMFCVMYIFALALFDVFMLSLPGANIGANMSAKKGYIGAFFTGIFAVLAGSACTGPLLGTAIGIAFNMNAIAMFSIFIFIGIGLGFPFLLISFFPKMIKILPKPGDWMTIFKEGLAVILLIFSLKFLKIVLDLTSLSFIMIHVLPFAAILLLSLKIYGKFVQPIFTKSTQWFAIIMTLVLIFCGWFFVLGVSFDDYEKEIINTTDNYWGKFSEEAVSNAINSNLPVFIDFTASWCANCKLNESRVLNKEDIKNTFNEKNVVMLKGDYTQGAKAEPVILEWLKKYNRAGVPLYLLFIPNEKEPIVFPEIISKKNILDALEKIIIE